MILLWLGVDPNTQTDRDNLVRGLEQLLVSDPSLSVRPGADGAVLLGATRDDQMETIVDRLAREFHVEATVTRPEIAYREALTRAAAGEGKFTHRRHYGHVKLRVEPGAPGSGYVFDNEIVGAAIPQAFIPAIDEGICDAIDRGVLAGYPLDDLRVTLVDGSYHDVDSTREAFRNAAALAFEDAARKAGPVLLEPIMRVSATAPRECERAVIDGLRARRVDVHLLHRATGSGSVAVAALARLADLFGYSAELRARTGGRGTFTMIFSHYAPVTHADDDGDREANVRSPLSPRTPPRILKAAVPEPRDDA